MAIHELTDFPSLLPPGRALFGLDLGEKTIGVAVSDHLQQIASALVVIERKKFTTDLAALLALYDERQIGGLVIGLPVNMDGTEGPRCQSSRAFARNLLKQRDLPIAFWDERLSTAAVERMLIGDANLSRAKRDAVIDRAAAAYILQGALDRLRHFNA